MGKNRVSQETVHKPYLYFGHYSAFLMAGKRGRRRERETLSDRHLTATNPSLILHFTLPTPLADRERIFLTDTSSSPRFPKSYISHCSYQWWRQTESFSQTSYCHQHIPNLTFTTTCTNDGDRVPLTDISLPSALPKFYIYYCSYQWWWQTESLSQTSHCHQLFQNLTFTTACTNDDDRQSLSHRHLTAINPSPVLHLPLLVPMIVTDSLSHTHLTAISPSPILHLPLLIALLARETVSPMHISLLPIFSQYYIWWWLFLTCNEFGRMFDCSFPACAFFFLSFFFFFFEVEIS